MDRFENYIKDHKQELDKKSPPPSVWDRIEDNIQADEVASESSTNFSWLWKVAAVLFFGITVYLTFDKFSVNKDSDPLWAEFRITEDYYTSLIDTKKSQLELLSSNDLELSDDFNKDLLELDSIYNNLIEEYKRTGSNQVMDAMIQNLRVRLNVLDDQLEILQKVNEFESSENETTTI